MNKIKIKVYTYRNGIPIEQREIERPAKWVLQKDSKKIYDNISKNIGIGLMHPLYIEVNEAQDRGNEYQKILAFLKKYVEYYANKNDQDAQNINLEFINYGKTELVYVMTDARGKRTALLVKQPIVQLGDVYQEMQNLKEFHQKDDNVIDPIDYFQLDDQELYVTPYINQARCIASYDAWGMYIPEPYYRFEPFTREQEQVVNTCMIAKIVSLYDFERQEGISNCKLGGGDFMLPKGWETDIPTVDNTLDRLYLIAARRKIRCSFGEYTDIIHSEFSRATIAENQNNLILNLRGRVPMKLSDIDAGINLGKTLLKTKCKKLQ